MDLEQAFGHTLRRLRTERHLSQETLSFESGIDRSYLSELENGHKAPSLATVFRLADALDMSPSSFISEIEKAVTAIDPEDPGEL